MMDMDELLDALKPDSLARLRHLIFRREGICPFGLRARLISDRQVIMQACHLLLDGEERIPPVAVRHPPLDKGGKTECSAGFDMERFLAMKEGGNEAV